MTASPPIDALQHPEWLGTWTEGLRVAFPTQTIHAVFSSQSPVQVDSAISPLDVHVHAGVPVFVMPLAHWLSTEPHMSSPAEPLQRLTEPPSGWIVAFQPQSTRTPGASACIGCRVQGIQGPFRAAEHEGYVEFDGIRWPTWTPQQLA